MPSYSIKNLKTGPSREWGPNGAFSCTLYCDKQKVAAVNEYGDGGEIHIDWVDRRAGFVEVSDERELAALGMWHTAIGEGKTMQASANELAMARSLVGTMRMNSISNENEQITISSRVFELVEEFEQNKQIKRWCRTKTVVRMKDNKKGQYSTFGVKFSPAVKKDLQARYGGKIVEFVNERFSA